MQFGVIYSSEINCPNNQNIDYSVQTSLTKKRPAEYCDLQEKRFWEFFKRGNEDG